MDLPALTPRSNPLSLAQLERRIAQRIKEFEPTALLDLLASIGYAPEHIAFCGHLSASPQPSIVHDIKLLGRPRGEEGAADPRGPRVVITVNLGLVSCRSPLPSYLLRLCHELDTRDPVREMLDILDRSLLHTRLSAQQPERLLPNWSDVKDDFVRVHGLDSPMGLRWLFRHVFPELSVEVKRVIDDYRVPSDAARLNYSELGNCAFGDMSRLTVQDIEVTLTTDEALYWGQPWPTVADRRIRRHVLPRLTEVTMNLSVVMQRIGTSSRARLTDGRPFQPVSFMGYDPMLGNSSDTQGSPPVRMVLYRGALPLSDPGTDDLEHLLAEHGGTPLELVRNKTSRRDGTVHLRVRYTPTKSHAYTYDAQVHWGARAWYLDEPFEMTLSLEGVPQPSPTPSAHPNLWLWLRDAARIEVADHLALGVTVDTALGETVSLALIERLIERGVPAALYALSWSRRTPAWDADAWQRFLQWSEG